MAKKTGKKIAKGPDKRATLKVTVLFNHDYVAERGPGIMGRAGDEKVFPWSPDLERLFTLVPEGKDEPILEKIDEVDSNSEAYQKSRQAGNRETAEAK